MFGGGVNRTVVTVGISNLCKDPCDFLRYVHKSDRYKPVYTVITEALFGTDLNFVNKT